MTDADAGLPAVEDVTEWFREKGFSLTIEEPNGSDRFHAYAVKVTATGNGPTADGHSAQSAAHNAWALYEQNQAYYDGHVGQ